ncbi:TolC family protein [Elusimicrobiota bacterium]
MMIIRSALIAVVLLAQPVFSQGEPAVVMRLTLSQAVEKAVNHSKDIRISAQKVEKAKRAYKKIRTNAMPQVSGNVKWDKYIKSPVITVDFGAGVQNIPIKQDYEMQTSIALSQTITSFGRLSAAMDVARKAIDIQRLSADIARNEIVYAVKQAYYTILYAQEALGIAQDSHKNALDNQKALKSRVRAGRASRIDNVKMKADVHGRIPPKLEAGSRLDSLVISFKEIIGAPENAQIELVDALTREFPVYTQTDLRSRMMLKEPVLRTFKESILLSENRLRLRKKDYFPVLSALANYSYSGNSNDTFPRDQMEPMFSVGLAFSIPLWDSGLRRHSYHEAASDLDIAKLKYSKRQESLDAALRSALSEYHWAVDIYKAGLKALEVAQQSYEITLSSFRSGSGSQSQLNDAELHLSASKIKTKQSLYEINILMARIEKLTAMEQGEK